VPYVDKVKNVKKKHGGFPTEMSDMANPYALRIFFPECFGGKYKPLKKHNSTRIISLKWHNDHLKRTAIEWDYDILPPSSIKGLPTDKNV
jgi:hypothetical protein